MSTASVNAVSVNTTTFPIHLTISAVPNLLPVVRRPSHQQGRALELLGHAIEYLIDSELGGPFGDGLSQPSPTLEAVQIMVRANREIFAACPIRLTLSQKIRHSFSRSKIAA